MLLIKNGYMIDPKSGWDGNYDILVDGEKIIRIGKKLEVPKSGCQVLDAEGLLVAPGLVDVHVHFREPGFTKKEDITTGAKAAAKGWFYHGCADGEYQALCGQSGNAFLRDEAGRGNRNPRKNLCQCDCRDAGTEADGNAEAGRGGSSRLYGMTESPFWMKTLSERR